jgi:hypothetical protein
MASTIAVRRGSFSWIVIAAAVVLVAAGAVTTAVVIAQTGSEVEPQRVAPRAVTYAAGNDLIRLTTQGQAMQELVDWADSYGYTVAGSSPASSRFIPVTPWAAYESRGFAPDRDLAGEQ